MNVSDLELDVDADEPDMEIFINSNLKVVIEAAFTRRCVKDEKAVTFGF